MRYLLSRSRPIPAGFRGFSTTRAARNPFLRVSEEVRAALAEKKPVVALESAVYTHGFPKPENLELAKQMEKAVRDNGAVPATICILGGKACVGLSASEIEHMNDAAATEAAYKVSRRDLPYVLGLPLVNQKRSLVGGTTVAGTMAIAHMAGIKVFGTGGIGGVHPGIEKYLDVSADLTELGRTNVAVISSGAKSFLDLPKTVEYLETEGVYVATFRDKDYGANDTVMFPAFFARSFSNLKAPSVVESPAEAAGIIYASHAMGLKSGQLFTNPVPLEYEIPHSKMEAIIASATEKAESAGVRGRDVTPYILNEIRTATNGGSVRGNRALLVNNAGMAGRVAVELAKLENSKSGSAPNSFIPPPTPPASPPPESPARATTVESTNATENSAPTSHPEVVVVGGVAVDLTCDPTAPPELHTSNPSRISESLGGVGSNVARALHRCRVPTRLVSSVGDDVSGLWIRDKLQHEGPRPMDITGIATSSTHPTARYISFTDSHGGLLTAAADMEIHAHQDVKVIKQHLVTSTPPKFVIIDGNLSKPTTLEILKICHKAGIKVIFEPTSTPKSTHIVPPSSAPPPVYPTPHLFAASPNIHELTSLHTAFSDASHFSTHLPWFGIIDTLNLNSNYRDLLPRISRSAGVDLVADGTLQRAVMLLPYIGKLWIKMGERGCVVVELVPNTEDHQRYHHHHPQSLFPEEHTDDSGSAGSAEIRHKASDRAAERFGIWGCRMAHYPAAETMEKGSVVSVNGAGDTFLGVFVAGLCRGMEESEAVHRAQRASVRTLKSRESVGDLEGLIEE